MKPRKEPGPKAHSPRGSEGHSPLCLWDGFDWWCPEDCPTLEVVVPSDDVEVVDVSNSSMVKQLRYVSHMSQLQVTFVNGQLYTYADVPQNVFDNVTTAKSVGKAFHEFIVKKGYTFTKGEKETDQS